MADDLKTQEYLYDALGRMIVEFQALERAIESIIFCTMTSAYEQMRIIFSEMSFKSKVHVFSSLVKNLHSENDRLYDDTYLLDRVDHIVKSCNTSESRRNQLIHSFWVPEFKSAPNLVMRIKESSKSRSGYKYSVESIKTDSLEEDIKFIRSTRENVDDFCMKLSIQYNYHHGMIGMGSLIDHAEIIEFINKKVLARAEDSNLRNS